MTAHILSVVNRLDTVTLVVFVITLRVASVLKPSSPAFEAKYIRGCITDVSQGSQEILKQLLTCASSGSCEMPGSVQLCQMDCLEAASEDFSISRV